MAFLCLLCAFSVPIPGDAEMLANPSQFRPQPSPWQVELLPLMEGRMLQVPSLTSSLFPPSFPLVKNRFFFFLSLQSKLHQHVSI